MKATKKNIGIFYRYNKYRPISGSMFYALEYYFTLMDTVERENQDNLLFGKDLNETEITLYWIFPKKLISTKEQKEKFRTRLLRLAAAKYPLTYKWTKIGYSPNEPKSRTSINKILGALEETSLKGLKGLNQSDKDSILDLNKKLDSYFKNIKIITEMDLLKVQADKSLFISQNTVHDGMIYDLIIEGNDSFGKKYFICNREFQAMIGTDQNKWKKLTTNKDSKFLYELSRQIIDSENKDNQERYSLKLGTQWFWSKDIIRKYKKYLKNNHIKFEEIMKTGSPVVQSQSNNSYFDWIDDELNSYGYNQFHLYMIWSSIHYYKTGFDENNRSIIESNFYNIPFKIIEDNKPMTEYKQEQYIESLNDSLQGRKENPNNYILTKDDKLINELLQ